MSRRRDGSNPSRLGEKHHNAKYSDETIAIIRKNYNRWIRVASKASPKALSHRFGIPYYTVISICHGRHRTSRGE